MFLTRSRIASTLAWGIFLTLITLTLTVLGKWSKPGIPIYMYHSISQEVTCEYPSLQLRPDDLERQLDYLEQTGFTPIFIEELPHAHQYHRPVVLTFDDGYEDNYTTLFPIILRRKIPITLFLISEKLDKPGYLTSAQVKEMSDSGLVSIQSHTATHHDLRELSAQNVEQEMRNSKQTLESITGHPVSAVAYPAGHSTEEVESIAHQYYSLGIKALGWGNYDVQHPMRIFRIGVFRDTTLEEFKTDTQERQTSRLQFFLSHIFRRPITTT